MSESKIEIKIGEITFSGQGEPDWAANQLDKILAQAEKLVQLASRTLDNTGGEEKGSRKPMGNDPSIAKKTLPAFLQEKNASSNQIKRFLATAVWLEAKGKNRLATADVTTALSSANQKRLANPADCLNKNVGKGYCEKDGKQFFVTDDGKNSL